jgi:hypothetical protein
LLELCPAKIKIFKEIALSQYLRRVYGKTILAYIFADSNLCLHLYLYWHTDFNRMVCQARLLRFLRFPTSAICGGKKIKKPFIRTTVRLAFARIVLYRGYGIIFLLIMVVPQAAIVGADRHCAAAAQQQR